MVSQKNILSYQWFFLCLFSTHRYYFTRYDLFDIDFVDSFDVVPTCFGQFFLVCNFFTSNPESSKYGSCMLFVAASVGFWWEKISIVDKTDLAYCLILKIRDPTVENTIRLQ